MGQCNVEISARQSGVVPSAGDHSATQISGTPHGLELIRSCAKFYANGVATTKPTVQSSHPTGPSLNQSATSPPGVAKGSTINAVCLFFLVLPCLALAAIVWWGTLAPATKRPEDAAGYARASSAQAASQGLTPTPSSLQEATGVQAVSNAQSDIVIRKVKTQPISAGTSAAPDSDGKAAEISATD